MTPKRLLNSVIMVVLSGCLLGWLWWSFRSDQARQLDQQLIAAITTIVTNKEQERKAKDSLTPSLAPQSARVSEPRFEAENEMLRTATVSSPLLHRPTATSAAQVKRVIDGDTIELMDGQVVRYIGVDTPETKHPNKAVECFGKEAAKQNETLVAGKTVILESDVSKTDRYGRLLRYVWVDGQLVNWQLVATGFAYAKSYPPDVSYQQVFNSAQAYARKNQIGLWGACPLR